MKFLESLTTASRRLLAARLRCMLAATCLALCSIPASAAPLNYAFSASFQGSGTFTLDVAGASFSSTLTATNVSGTGLADDPGPDGFWTGVEVTVFDDPNPGDYSVMVNVLGSAGPVANIFLLDGLASSLSAETVWFELVDSRNEINFATPGVQVPAPPTLMLLGLGLLGLGIKRPKTAIFA